MCKFLAAHDRRATALQESQSTAEDQAALAELFFNFLLQFA